MKLKSSKKKKKDLIVFSFNLDSVLLSFGLYLALSSTPLTFGLDSILALLTVALLNTALVDILDKSIVCILMLLFFFSQFPFFPV